MNDFLAQIILAARRDDAEFWMQILVFVIVIAFWALGGILRAKSRKSEQQQEEELARRTARKPPGFAKGLQEQFLHRPGRPAGPVPRRQYRPQVQQPRRKVVRPQPAVEKVAAKAGRAIRLAGLEALEAPELSTSVLPKEPAELLGEPLKGLENKLTGIVSETPQPELLIEKPLLDYADPDELRRAILHYEILGKPLSLRGPGEQIIGL